MELYNVILKDGTTFIGNVFPLKGLANVFIREDGTYFIGSKDLLCFKISVKRANHIQHRVIQRKVFNTHIIEGINGGVL